MNRISDLRRHGLFNAKVPRFTSYPPANRFTQDVSDSEAADWLKATPDGSDISLYVHIPFCRRLCWFCACRTQGTKTDAPLGRYVASVLAEMAMVRARLPQNIRVRRLHLGGGTPTILPVDLINELLGGLDKTFGLGGLDEFSVEIDPTEVDSDRLRALSDFGMNRASLGVQDFDPRVQKAIGRKQSIEETARTSDALRALGVAAVNIDLLYGLPFQTMDSLRQTLDHVMALEPTRLALYGYAHVPWMSKRQVVIPTDALPGPEDRYALFDLARRHFLGEKYLQIGIDHFALQEDGLALALVERRLARSFQGYTDDRVPRLIGLGASSISRLPQGYLQNQAATALYQASIAKGQLAAFRGFALDAAAEARAEIIEQLMCYHSVRVADLHTKNDRVQHWLNCLAADYPDAIRFDGRILTIEPWARPLVRIFAARLGQERSEQQTFSAAI